MMSIVPKLQLALLFVACFVVLHASALGTSKGVKKAAPPVSRFCAKTSPAAVSAFPNVDIQVLKGNTQPEGCTAFGNYSFGNMIVGWDTFVVESNASAATATAASVAGDDALSVDIVQGFAAGFAEGYFSVEATLAHRINQQQWMNISDKVQQWYKDHLAWLDKQTDPATIRSLSSQQDRDYWHQIAVAYTYYNGMYNGTVAALAKKHMTNPFTAFSFFVLFTELEVMDVGAACGEHNSKTADWSKMTDAQLDAWLASNGHCSSLIKLLPDLSDLYFSHTSWAGYPMMNRILKKITLNLVGGNTKAKTITMSSYPVAVSSFDDFYTLDTGFAVIETSINVYNLSIYNYTIPQTVMYGFRVLAANRMASSGEEWAQVFSRYNSGTYNNEWLIVDLNRFQPGNMTLPGTLTIVDQMPGKIAYQDFSQTLALGYFASYNVPAIESIFNYSGSPAIAHRWPTASWQMAPRAQIFRRDEGNVQNMKDYKFLMQYNDYENDPLSHRNPTWAIAARGDLLHEDAWCGGAYDLKVGSYSMFLQHKKNAQSPVMQAFSGPTPQQPRFNFSTTLVKCAPHVGIVDAPAFDWIDF